MWQRFSANAKRVVYHAQEIAKSLEDGQVSSAHLLIALCWEAGTTAAGILAHFKLSQGQVQIATEEALPPERIAGGRGINLTRDAKRVVELAYDEARLLGDRNIGTEHLLLACVRCESGIAPKVLAATGVTIDAAREALRASRGT